MQPPPAAPVVLQPGRESAAGEGGCNEARWLAKHPPVGEVISFVNDPFAYAPVPLRTVVMGMVGRTGARSRSCSAPAPRARSRSIPTGCSWPCCPAATGTRTCGSSPPSTGKRVAGFPLQGFNGPAALEVPQARAPDPERRTAVGLRRERLCSPPRVRSSTGAWSRWNPRAGRSTPGPTGGAAAPPARDCDASRRRCSSKPRATPAPAFGGRTAANTRRREVERRTLPGRTIITGRADADVAAVTIVTPRDVRTLRPSGPAHVLIAVYDGQFFSGRITATVLLRSGKTGHRADPRLHQRAGRSAARTVARQPAAEHPPRSCANGRAPAAAPAGTRKATCCCREA